MAIHSDSLGTIQTQRFESQPQNRQTVYLRNLHVWPMQCIKPSKWQLMPNTCCGFAVFLAGLTVSSTTLWYHVGWHWLWNQSFGLAAALPLGAAEGRRRSILAIRSTNCPFSAWLKTTQKPSWSIQSRPAHRVKNSHKLRGGGIYSTNCEVTSECAAQ